MVEASEYDSNEEGFEDGLWDDEDQPSNNFVAEEPRKPLHHNDIKVK